MIHQHADGIAGERDAWVNKNPAYYSEDRRYIRFLVSTSSRMLDLDLGCGTGDLLGDFEPSLGVGVDLSPALIDRAQSKQPHHSRLRFRRCET